MRRKRKQAGDIEMTLKADEIELFNDLRAFSQLMSSKAETPLERQFSESISRKIASLVSKGGS